MLTKLRRTARIVEEGLKVVSAEFLEKQCSPILTTLYGGTYWSAAPYTFVGFASNSLSGLTATYTREVNAGTDGAVSHMKIQLVYAPVDAPELLELRRVQAWSTGRSISVPVLSVRDEQGDVKWQLAEECQRCGRSVIVAQMAEHQSTCCTRDLQKIRMEMSG